MMKTRFKHFSGIAPAFITGFCQVWLSCNAGGEVLNQPSELRPFQSIVGKDVLLKVSGDMQFSHETVPHWQEKKEMPPMVHISDGGKLTLKPEEGKKASLDFIGSKGQAFQIGRLYRESATSLTISGFAGLSFSCLKGDHYGGAILVHEGSTLNIVDNTGPIIFQGNVGDRGGALAGRPGSTINITGNEDKISFEANIAKRIGANLSFMGGAIYMDTESTLNITGNENGVVFRNNEATDEMQFQSDGYVGGGAIKSEAGSKIVIANNRSDIVFDRNLCFKMGHAYRRHVPEERKVPLNSAAIEASGDLEIYGNERIVFEDSNRIGILMKPGYMGRFPDKKLVLAVPDYNSDVFNGMPEIVFHSALIAENGGKDSKLTVWLNKYCSPESGENIDTKGNIIFSGKHAKALIEAPVGLYGGNLNIADGALFQSKGMKVEGHGTWIAMSNGTLAMSSATEKYGMSFGQYTRLFLTGCNTVIAERIDMHPDSAITLYFRDVNRESPVLTLEGPVDISTLNIHLLPRFDELAQTTYKLLTVKNENGASPSSFPKITYDEDWLEGASRLRWEGDTLVFEYTGRWPVSYIVTISLLIGGILLAAIWVGRRNFHSDNRKLNHE